MRVTEQPTVKQEQSCSVGQPVTPVWYQVILLNDDFTPMDFVVDLLELIFQMRPGQAQKTMMQVHKQGRAVCGVYPVDIAESKVERVLELAERYQYPLGCLMEKI